MALSWSELFSRVPADNSATVDRKGLAAKLDLQDPSAFSTTMSLSSKVDAIASMVNAAKSVFGATFTAAEFKFIGISVDYLKDAPTKEPKSVLPAVTLTQVESQVVDMMLRDTGPIFRAKQCTGCAKPLAPFRTPIAGYSCNGCHQVLEIGTWVNACNDHAQPEEQVHVCIACNNNGAVSRLGGPEKKPAMKKSGKGSRSINCLASVNRAPNTDINLTYVGRKGAMVDAGGNVVAYGILRRNDRGAFFLDYGESNDWYQLREGYDFVLGKEPPETLAIAALAPKPRAETPDVVRVPLARSTTSPLPHFALGYTTHAELLMLPACESEPVKRSMPDGISLFNRDTDADVELPMIKRFREVKTEEEVDF